MFNQYHCPQTKQKNHQKLQMIMQKTLIYFKTSQQRIETGASYHFSNYTSITVVKTISETGLAQKLQPRECTPSTVIIPVPEYLKKYILTT